MVFGEGIGVVGFNFVVVAREVVVFGSGASAIEIAVTVCV